MGCPKALHVEYISDVSAGIELEPFSQRQVAAANRKSREPALSEAKGEILRSIATKDPLAAKNLQE